MLFRTIGFVMIAALLSSCAQSPGNENVAGDTASTRAVWESRKYRRFLDEKDDYEFILMRNIKLSHSLYKFLGEAGRRLVWQVPIDCSIGVGQRLRGKTVEEVLDYTAKEFYIRIIVYSNGHVVTKPRDNPLATCGGHQRINLSRKEF